VGDWHDPDLSAGRLTVSVGPIRSMSNGTGKGFGSVLSVPNQRSSRARENVGPAIVGARQRHAAVPSCPRLNKAVGFERLPIGELNRARCCGSCLQS
jgi:hypothetical protein